MNAKQRRRAERIEDKYRNELIDIMLQLKSELVNKELSLDDFIKLVDEIILDAKR